MTHEKVKIFCNKCEKDTNHSMHFSKRIEHDDGQVDWYYLYQTLECDGCNEVSYRTRYWFSEDQYFVPNEPPIFHDTYFPPRYYRKFPNWISDLNNEALSSVMQEVYKGLYGDLHFLTAVGIRTAIDLIIIEKLSDKGSYEEKIKKLKNEGLIDEDESKMLVTVVELGHAAAHRGFSPKIKDLNLALDVLERIIAKLYFADKASKEILTKIDKLKNKIPKRNP